MPSIQSQRWLMARGERGRGARWIFRVIGMLLLWMAIVMVTVGGGCFSYNTLPERKWVESQGGILLESRALMSWRRAAIYIIDLSGTRVSDADLENLSMFKGKVFDLDLSNTEIDGSGMPRMASIVSVTSMDLSLRGTRVTDDTLSRFVEGVRFLELDLSNTAIGDAGVAALLRADDIGTLDLSNTKVTRAGIQQLKDIEYLRWLSLQGLDLTDADVPMLAELATKDRTMRTLNVSGTGISREGIARLRNAAPRTTVIAARQVIFIQDCARPGDEYRMEPYLAVARALQEEGQVVAIAKLREWARTPLTIAGLRVIVLCRMLFEAPEDEEFEDPENRGVRFHRLRGFVGGTSAQDWPGAPLTVYRGAPILVARGDSFWAQSSGGVHILGSNPGVRFVDSFARNYRWRSEKYPELGTDEMRDIIREFIENTEWKKPLTDAEKTFLLRQAEPPATDAR